MSQPDISYIVSCYDRPKLLPVCLYSLQAQTHEDFEVLVTDNATDPRIAAQHRRAVEQLCDDRFRYFRTAGKVKVSDCYWSAEWAVKIASGKWFCFPCDDSYYAPEFGQRMLGAAYANAWRFVSCNAIIGPEASGGSGYALWKMPLGKVTKTCFLIHSETFHKLGQFAGKPSISQAMAADYALSALVAKRRIRAGNIDHVMVVHN